MRVSSTIEISAPPPAVWEVVSDPGHYLQFLSGVTRWEVLSDGEPALGSRHRMHMRVGSAEIGAEVEFIEWDEPSDLAWTSVLGLDQRGRFRLRERRAGRTQVELRLSYGVAGAGVFGWLAERAAGPMVEGHLKRSLQQLKRQVEQEQTRRLAAERRERRTAAA
jgi:uncharacterized membrane protein